MDSSRRNLEAYPPTLTVSLHQFEKAGVFPSVIGETLDALELVALAFVELRGRHAALTFLPARASNASNARSVLAFGTSSPDSNRETVPWLTPNWSARAACDRPKAFLVAVMSI